MTTRPIIPDGPPPKQGDAERAPAHGGGQLAAAVSPAVAALLVLLAAAGSPSLSPAGLLGAAPWELLGWTLLGAAAALHRPFARTLLSPAGTSLGLGAAVVPAVLARHGAGPAALVAVASLVLAETTRRALVARVDAGPTYTRDLLISLERAILSGPAVLAAGAFARTVDDPPRVAGAIAIYVACSVGLLFAVAALRRRRARATEIVAPLAVDAVGWTVGAGLAASAAMPGIGWSRAWPAWAFVALLAVEAARQSFARAASEHRLDTYDRLREAHERILAETSGMGEIARQVLVECRNILPVQWFLFELPPEDGDDWAQSWAAGPDGLLVEGRPRPPTRPKTLPGIHRRASWRIFERELLGPAGPGGASDDEEIVLARLRLWCDPRQVEARAEELFDTLLPQMASSVHRALLDREAKLDPLTGVPVRRVLEARLQRAFHRSHDEGTPMAVILCDIDFFKKVNDTHGHDAGDEALKLVATTLDANRRDDDLCCRYGGEEFTILLERADGEAALGLAERLRRSIEALELVYDGRPIPLTLSLGVAAFPDLHVKTASELLLLADEALYGAKEGGRNQALLNIGHGAYRGVGRRQESSTTIARPVL